MNETTALLLVDLQKAIFGGFGIPPAHQAERLSRNAYALLQEARASGVPVVHVQHCGGPGEALEEGAPGSPIAPRLSPAANERVVQKCASNAFEGTDLRAVLRGLGTRDLVIAGIRRGSASAQPVAGRWASATRSGSLGMATARGRTPPGPPRRSSRPRTSCSSAKGRC